VNKLARNRIASLVVTSLSMMTYTSAFAQKIQPTLPGGKIRTYYIAAVETEWNYTPAGMDRMTGKPFEGETKIWTERGISASNVL
jgi:hypothetical protein